MTQDGNLFLGKYETETTPIRLGDKHLQFLEIANMEVVLEDILQPGERPEGERPFWAKIWESSLLLAHVLCRRPEDPEARYLELGCGMGVAGLFAAAHGHRVLLSDINEDALAFARANAALNGFDPSIVIRLDWRDPDFQGRFDVIFGSDILYSEGSYAFLISFLKSHLKPRGEVLLSVSAFISAASFFSEAEPHFRISQKKLSLRSEKESHAVFLYRLVLRE